MDEDYTLEFRTLRDIWEPCPRNWRLSFCPTTEKGIMRQGGKTLVDIQGQLFHRLSKVLGLLDEPWYMNAVAERSTVRIDLVRLRLSFFVNANGLLESRELNATVDEDQDIRCFYGLKNKVVLQSLNKWHARSVLIPYGHVELCPRRQNTLVSIRPPEACHKYFRYELDPHLRAFRGAHDIFSTLYQAYLHALTGFVLPDPATGRPGTDEAL
jgi:hypothetical protein